MDKLELLLEIIEGTGLLGFRVQDLFKIGVQVSLLLLDYIWVRV